MSTSSNGPSSVRVVLGSLGCVAAVASLVAIFGFGYNPFTKQFQPQIVPEPNSSSQDDAIRVLQARGVRFTWDENAPGRPVVGIDFSDGPTRPPMDARFKPMRVNLLTDATLVDLRWFPELHSLNLGSVKVRDDGLGHMASLQKLQELHIHFDDDVTEQGLQHLSQLGKLRELYLWAKASPNNTAFGRLADIRTLEKLVLFDATITDTEVKELARLTRLRDLSLYHCKDVTDAGVQALVGLPEVRELKLDGAKLTRIGAMALATLPRLEVLTLVEIDEAGLRELQRSPRLRGLGLYLHSLNEEGLKELARFPALEALSVSGKESQTKAKLKDLASIETLRQLSASAPMTDNDIKALAALQWLEALELTHASVTDVGLKELAAFPIRLIRPICLLICRPCTQSCVRSESARPPPTEPTHLFYVAPVTVHPATTSAALPAGLTRVFHLSFQGPRRFRSRHQSCPALATWFHVACTAARRRAVELTSRRQSFSSAPSGNSPSHRQRT